MSAPKPMSSLRRGPIPGTPSPEHREANTPPAETDAGRQTDATPRSAVASTSAATERPSRWPSDDYAATRLANFRLPVDLHDRYRQLVQDAERLDQRLRHPSLTEVIIALLEEGPTTGHQVVELIRRKRADEHRADR